MGLNQSKWKGTYAAVLLACHSTPTPCFRTLWLNLPVKNAEKTIVTQKVLVTQSSNIVHCNWHNQRLMCADFQAFSNTFSLFKLMFFHFMSGGFKQTTKNFTFCWFWLGEMHGKGLSGTYLGVWGMPNSIALVSSLYDKWFLKNHNFREKFHICILKMSSQPDAWL